ncbi:hypothetical protein DFH06DRAFT_1132545 [Mycena polygramma]|nr:hypothetical protein DFH06DRAFT_1132545 [Mycena polygramma]
MVSWSQAKPSRRYELALASGLRFSKPSQARQAMASSSAIPRTKRSATVGESGWIRGLQAAFCDKSSKSGCPFSDRDVETVRIQPKIKFSMAQASGSGLAWLAPGFGPGFNFPKPRPDKPKPKPWFPGQAKPAQHYLRSGGRIWTPSTRWL